MIEAVAVAALALVSLAVTSRSAPDGSGGLRLLPQAIRVVMLLVGLAALGRAAAAGVELGLRPEAAVAIERGRPALQVPSGTSPGGELAGALATAVAAGIAFAMTRGAAVRRADEHARRGYVLAVALAAIVLLVLGIGRAVGGLTQALAPEPRSGGSVPAEGHALELTQQEEGVAELVGNGLLAALAAAAFAFSWTRRDGPRRSDEQEAAGAGT